MFSLRSPAGIALQHIEPGYQSPRHAPQIIRSLKLEDASGYVVLLRLLAQRCRNYRFTSATGEAALYPGAPSARRRSLSRTSQ